MQNIISGWLRGSFREITHDGQEGIQGQLCDQVWGLHTQGGWTVGRS